MENNIESVNCPLVTLILTVSGYDDLFKKAFESALSQTYRNLEILVVFYGCGSDAEIRNLFRSSDGRIKYKKINNSDLSCALNSGFDTMNGEYFLWITPSVSLYPDCIEQKVRVLLNSPSIGELVFSNAEIPQDAVGRVTTRATDGRTVDEFPEWFLGKLFRGRVQGCSLLIKKSLIKRHGRPKAILPEMFDLDWLLRVSRDGSLIPHRGYTFEIIDRGQPDNKDRINEEGACFNLSEFKRLLSGVLVGEMASFLKINSSRIGSECTRYLKFASSKVMNLFLAKIKIPGFQNSLILAALRTFPQVKKINLRRVLSHVCSMPAYLQLTRKMRSIETDEKTVLILEPNAYHGIILAGYIEYFLRLGFAVHLLVNQKLALENPLCRLTGNFTEISFSGKRFLISRILKSRLMIRYKKILITSSICYGFSPPIVMHDVMNESCRGKTILVEHDLRNILGADESFFLKRGQVWTLIERRLPDGELVPMVCPHFFGAVRPAENHVGIVKFVSVGVVNDKYKNMAALERAMIGLIEQGISNFKVTVIGQISKGAYLPADERVINHFDYKGRLGFEEMFRELEEAQFILFLIDPGIEMYPDYLENLVSGAVLLSLGFTIIPILYKELGQRYGFTESCSIQYTDDLTTAMSSAARLDADGWRRMHDALKDLSKRIYSRSMETVKESLMEG